jgi:RHH-type proline utilization regulon transcriptional repressor/proline dehydrogenase/delta 1-pyrroline-5-carboxylate dehydrogenase
MLDKRSLKLPEGLRAQICQAYRENELNSVTQLIKEAELTDTQLHAIRMLAERLVQQVRSERRKTTGIDSFLTEYALSTEEGIALMCLAEALLRVPDKATVDSLIKDKITSSDWKSHLGQSDSFFVNAATWALMLTGKVLKPESAESVVSKALFKFLGRSSEGVVRKTVDTIMRKMSKQFVMGRTIQEALTRAQKKEAQGYRYSYDMLGEAALTVEDANRYYQAYTQAINAIGLQAKSIKVQENPGISIKISALHPRYQEAQNERVLVELTPKLLELARLAKKYNIHLTIDAEESERLELSMDLIERVFSDDSLAGWEGFGLAVQSYQKRAFYLLDWIAALARSKKRRIMVRLIKGAYWDSEIKKAQMQGFTDYPVFTRKVFTDVSFQACAKKLLTMTDAIYPAFATHNAYSVALILNLVGDYRDFEFQCLHGMGNELYEKIVPAKHFGIPCRVYAPAGSHEDLLPYLVRRLLENGANSSFVNRIVDDKAPIAELIEDPISKARYLLNKINQNIPLPVNIFPERKNSYGFDFTDRKAVAELQHAYEKYEFNWIAAPLIASKTPKKQLVESKVGLSMGSPQEPARKLGHVIDANDVEIEAALNAGHQFFSTWSQTEVTKRSAMVEKFADLLEENREQLWAMACLEAGKTLNDAVAELREAVDFCRYYAKHAEKLMGKPQRLYGYTGELNELSLHPRGLVLCISPWNFPLAIFVGQVVAALVTGNCVIAKPAEQTPLIAYFAVKLMHEAGIPKAAVQLIPGKGAKVGAQLVADKRIKAVIFTGSTQTAAHINLSLANRGGEIIPLIAETGGQNVMLVDSSALLEQVIIDVINSAFGSSGQRCSALRVIYVQEEVYPRFIQLLKGAMAELRIGNPCWLSTDIGPVIDNSALQGLQAHVDKMLQKYKLVYQCKLPADCNQGYFMAPTAIEIDNINALEKEIFGPILHIISYTAKKLDDVIDQVNRTGFGLTFGIHSRINHKVEDIRKRIHVGNCYVNRNMIGAVVGLQPFGGEGLSGTGPKAGGPHYLLRLCQERTYTVDTTAAGGNASLMSLPEGL